MKTTIAICVMTAALAATAGSAISSGSTAAVQAPASQPAAAGTQPGYAGSDTCVTCHSDKEESLKGTKHAQVKNPRTPAAMQGCESCHGPGQAHVDDDAKGHIKKFGQIPAAEISQTCLTCHNRGDHAAWEGSPHDRRNLSCATCHSVHSPKSAERQLVKPTQTQLCATCHRLQVTKTERAVAHMPVREGKMSCSSCHNPHGSISNVKNLKTAALSPSCARAAIPRCADRCCSSTRRCARTAPPVHDPHGSSNDRMLNVRMPMLCQRCHIASKHPATLYDKDQITTNKSNRMFGRSCVNCHSNVHGSNHPSGQFFMR
jgi:DmsE family decaheme c-type cytochrome